MRLHKDTELFNEIVENAAKYYGIVPDIIRKDYFVSLFLKEYKKVEPDFVFKGGTSLSKCYDVIKRFSEDIDLTFYQDNESLSEGERQRVNYHVKDACAEIEFTIMNLDEIRSRRIFNQYRIDTGFLIDASSIRDTIIVEIALQTLAFPVEKKQVNMYVYNYLRNNNHVDIIKEYMLEPFDVYVQDKVRTFVDKVFALCDYHLESKYEEHSRHIYDLFKLWPGVKNRIERNLVLEVRKIRAERNYCPSANKKYNINDLLNEIISSEVYKEDYVKITSRLLFEEVKYEEAINVISKIIDGNMFE